MSQDVLENFKTHLKEGGYIYASFKMGTFEGERNGRYYLDLTIDQARNYMEDVGFRVVKIWTTQDVLGIHRPQWINLISQK